MHVATLTCERVFPTVLWNFWLLLCFFGSDACGNVHLLVRVPKCAVDAAAAAAVGSDACGNTYLRVRVPNCAVEFLAIAVFLRF